MTRREHETLRCVAKRSKNIFEIFKKVLKLPTENIETLSQKQNVRRLFLQVRT